MTSPRQNDPIGEPLQRLDETLRIIATVPAPDGLTDRVKGNLRSASRSASVIAWPLAVAAGGWLHSSVVRGAAAAAIVCVVAGGGWQIYSHVQPAASDGAILVPARVGNSGAFSNANARHTPDTLNRPVVPQAAEPAPAAVDTKANQQGTNANAKAAGKRKQPAAVSR